MARFPRSRRLLPLAIAPLLVLGAVPAATHHAPTAAHAQVLGTFSFTPLYGDASTQRLVQFSGFDADEAVDLTFTNPSGQAVTVSGYTTWLASAQDDGTGAFFFRPSDWLDSVDQGSWSVQITGQTSGATATTVFWIGYGN
jgi:hypothetical protein